MEAADLRLEFEKQVKDADTKIVEAEKNLVQLKEYKTKLLGGLETLELLNPKTEETQDGVPEQSVPATGEVTPSDTTVSSETGV
tara:strand:+ start:48 stop:299 length:252 start_codon:yes stop_codon:yes gene_type:complete